MKDAWYCLAVLVALTPATVRAGGVQYSRDIQPILADNCYTCHGPDKENRQAGLRLDLREQALADRDGTPAIARSHPEKSELVRRIFSDDPNERMPPPKSRHQLTAAQKNALRQWIAEGAVWTKHWSLIPPERPTVPPTKEPGWVRNRIDAFILARLEQEGLRHSAEAGKETLIRRVTLDLTGLLPTPQETAAFLADKSPTAYEKLVDRLLASKAYGEHRARYWLDYARFGDTQGIHVDAYQNRWPFRDYVIRAFNADEPYDQFTREQLAGDLLPPEHVDQLTATGFIRCGIASGEGGTIIEELRCNVKRERTEAYGAVFMGMTVGCAVCHDHKYDPISTKDFYGLTAFFNNLAEKPSTDDRADWCRAFGCPRASISRCMTPHWQKRRVCSAKSRPGGPCRRGLLPIGSPRAAARDRFRRTSWRCACGWTRTIRRQRGQHGSAQFRSGGIACDFHRRGTQTALGRGDVALAFVPPGNEYPRRFGPRG